MTTSFWKLTTGSMLIWLFVLVAMLFVTSCVTTETTYPDGTVVKETRPITVDQDRLDFYVTLYERLTAEDDPDPSRVEQVREMIEMLQEMQDD